MPTLILTSRYTNDSQALWRAATNQGWDVVRLVKWSLPEEAKACPWQLQSFARCFCCCI